MSNRRRQPGEQVTWFRCAGNTPMVPLAATVIRDNGISTRIKLAVGEHTEHTVRNESIDDGWVRASKKPEAGSV